MIRVQFLTHLPNDTSIFCAEACAINIVTWYARERESEGEVNTPFYLNQQALRKIESYLYPMPFSLLNERSQGQSSGVDSARGWKRKVG